MPDIIQVGGSGLRGEYHWMTNGHFGMGDLLERCPQVVMNRYVAITSLDSGAVRLEEQELVAGWRSRDEVAYSPRIESVNPRLLGLTGGWDEWYVSQVPLNLGRLSGDNIFENEMAPGRVFALVNFPHFQLHEGEGNPLVKLFWEQLAWIQPESFICDGGDFLTFVSREINIFESVFETLR